ncbi:zinc finger DHHC domain-containing protein 4-like [Mizuhopecten yessoensis]|uniref:Palmitoyltransferase n=1 Tax=Mizuhopecten yessoensis TaxID=6573 RepID=A0A210PPG8_MIZYE|nr:zinc finger DHHC domain-containing protein 4-like [Mizuhopecten yessoensis]OWF38400.1 palmitoyltransferase ZDHHC22 [Mizuhopecten yessoensis]
MVSMRLLFGWSVPFRIRLMAAGNLFFCFYFAFMTVLVTVVCWSEILPDIFMGDKDRIRKHKLFILFTFLNAVGNFVLCVFTDTSIKRAVEMTSKDYMTSTSSVGAGDRMTKPSKDAGQSRLNSKDSQTISTMNNSNTMKQTTKKGASMVKKRKAGEAKSADKESIKDKYLEMKGKGKDGGNDKVDNEPTFCDTCNVIPPPRSHHCVLCQTCILKRDHHCFFMTVCVGYFNQKYFVMYCFYMMIGTFYGMFLIVLHLKKLYDVTFNGPQTFIFLLVDMIGKLATNVPIEFGYIFLVFLMYACITAGLIAAGLWFWQLQITVAGQTTHEATSIGSGKFSKSKIDNLKDVFGKYWLLTIILPLPLPQPPFEDTFVKNSNSKNIQ